MQWVLNMAYLIKFSNYTWYVITLDGEYYSFPSKNKALLFAGANNITLINEGSI